MSGTEELRLNLAILGSSVSELERAADANGVDTAGLVRALRGMMEILEGAFLDEDDAEEEPVNIFECVLEDSETRSRHRVLVPRDRVSTFDAAFGGENPAFSLRRGSLYVRGHRVQGGMEVVLQVLRAICGGSVVRWP
ncbi:MAG: hypothetical protein EBS89_07440 [Proteobacteria bacterium]|nr:hypothetical protein [Pseudomonadota bacterium]